MFRPMILPRIVIIGLLVMVIGAILAASAYYYETQVIGATTELPLFNLFADAFKVGLGAFIGVLSQWASRVFVEREALLDEVSADSDVDGGGALGESVRPASARSS